MARHTHEQAEESQLRNKRIPETRVTPDELALIKQRAADLGYKSVSAFQREMLLNRVPVVRNNVLDIETVSVLNRIGSELNKNGSNINQLAKYAHHNRHINPDFMQSVLDRHERLLQDLEKLSDALMGFSE